MTKVTCPKCNYTFEIRRRPAIPVRNKRPGWTKYSNAQGLKCECECCRGLFDEVYMYIDTEYYADMPLARYITPLPFRRFVCKDCIDKYLTSEQLAGIERDGYILT